MGRPIDFQIALTPWGEKARFSRAKVGLARKGSTVYIAIFNYLGTNKKIELSPNTIELLPAAIRCKKIECDLFLRNPSDEHRYLTMMREIKTILKRETYGQSDKADTFNRFIAQIPSLDDLNPKNLVPVPLVARFNGTKTDEGGARDRCYACGQITSCGKFFGCGKCQETNGIVNGNNVCDGDTFTIGQIINECSRETLAYKRFLNRLDNQHLKAIKFYKMDRPLPKELWLRDSLSELTISGCNLTEIPKEMMTLASTLYYLDLSDNKIDKLPRVFCCKMNNLRLLNLKHNQIETLPIEIKFFSNLIDLDISENCLRMLPTTFSDLSSLKYLNVANNNLSQLPAFRTDQIRLRRLDVSDNPLDGALRGYNTFEVYPSYDGPISYNENLFCPLTSPISKKKHFPKLFEISMLKIVRCDQLLKLASEESLPRSIVSTMQRDIFKCYRCSKMNILPAYNSTDFLDYLGQVEMLMSSHTLKHGMTFMKLLCTSCFDKMR